MNQLIEEYREAAALHGKATAEGDSETANRAYQAAENAFKALVVAGEDGKLLELYNDPHPSVQLWAAAHTLEISEDMALDKLRALESSNAGLVSIDAKYSIKEWNLGEMRIRKRLGLWKD
jgi:hypothetical protein